MKFNHTAHKALWKWFAENPGMYKSDWPGWRAFLLGVENNCFACEYACGQAEAGEDYCHACPLEWGTENCGGGGLFGSWAKARNLFWTASAAKIARQIANLPVKPGVECE